jgi:small subunit ribosomal protein S5
VIEIKRVSKTVKGGKRFNISATVVVGDGNSMVGIGHAKAQEVVQAVRKATERAKKNMVKISVKGRTIAFPVQAKFGASKVLLKPASPGTGIIACQQVRAPIEAIGIQDILTKSFGSRNPYNLAIATIKALQKLRTLEEIARMRNKPIPQIIGKDEETKDNT